MQILKKKEEKENRTKMKFSTFFDSIGMAKILLIFSDKKENRDFIQQFICHCNEYKKGISFDDGNYNGAKTKKYRFNLIFANLNKIACQKSQKLGTSQRETTLLTTMTTVKLLRWYGTIDSKMEEMECSNLLIPEWKFIKTNPILYPPAASLVFAIASSYVFHPIVMPLSIYTYMIICFPTLRNKCCLYSDTKVYPTFLEFFAI